MTDPISATIMGVVGLGSTILGGETSAKGAAEQGIAQLKQNYYQAGIAQFNANVARQNADYERNRGEQEAQQYGIAGAQKMGAITAAQGASGLDVNTGSAAAVRAGEARVQAMDLTQIRSNAAKAAYNYDVEAQGFENQSALYTMAGTNAVDAANINVESSIIGTASSVASKWSQGSQVGLFNNLGSAASSLGSGISDAASFVSGFGF